MAIFGQIEEFFSEVVYPNRYVFGAFGVIAAAAIAVLAYRLGGFAWMARNRRTSMVVGVPLLAAVGIGFYFLASPLWERSELIEASPLDTPPATNASPSSATTPSTTVTSASLTPAASPTANTPASPTPASAGSSPTATPPTAAFSPRVVSQGEWQGADDFHFARGKALLIESAPGVYTVRVEDFSVRNGPDLFVYLSTSASGYSDDGINLGGLKATDGAFNYEVPAGTDISRFESVVVWCKAFSVLFGTAALTPPTT